MRPHQYDPGQTFQEGDYLSIDGTLGEVYAGELKTAPSEILQVLLKKTLKPEESQTYQNFKKLMDWCAKATRLQVRTNADTPEQTANAVAFGAVGIGLCRTEHMFFEGDRIDAMREMILAENIEARRVALAKLLPYQRGDFIGIFKALNGLPATIRFLDPPLHEFLPHEADQINELTQKSGIPTDRISKRVKLMKIAVELGRKTRPDIKLGICGEHGGDPASVKFCHHTGLNYVSCSPFRVPIARLAAAQAALEKAKPAKKK